MHNAAVSRSLDGAHRAERSPAFRLIGRANHLDLLRAHGYVIFDRLLSEDTVDRINRELEPWFAATPRCRGDFYGWNTTRFGALLMKSQTCHSLITNGLILAIMDGVLGPHCDWYQLNLSQAIRIHPGERQQVPHRDEEMWPCRKDRVEYLVNVMWALSDFTAENGATRLWPRSQFDALSRDVNNAEAIVAEMPRGSALVYLGSVTHCAGANISTAPRTGLIMSYSLGWLKQYENAFLTYPPHVAANFSKSIRDLLGYRIHRPNLGGYEGQDPSVLFETNSHTLAAVDAISEATALELQAHYRSGAGGGGDRS
jgi:ectoine hydroxylase-related dioxygenase (phytanoyl-CoA dioxygenase family)